MMKNNLLLLSCFLLLSSCGCSNQNQAVLPPAHFLRYADAVPVRSEILGQEHSMAVLLPESYVSEPGKRYPVVYCLHGLGDEPTSWNDQWLAIESTVKGLEANGLEEMIYIFPQGFRTYYVNRYDGKYPYMDYFVKELVPYVDKTYRTIADRNHRAITGYSMGGFGAWILAAKHPELFGASAPLSISMRTDQQYMTEGPQSGWDYQWGRIFGASGLSGAARLTDYYKENCPFYQFTPENKAQLSRVRWFFTCGDNEPQLLIGSDSLHVIMRDAGYDHEYRVTDGGHDGTFWRSALREVLPFFSSCFAGQTAWNMTFQTPSVPEITLEADGAFASKAFKEGKDGASAIWLCHNGLPASRVKEIISILQRGRDQRSFVILPCDLSVKPLGEWKWSYEAPKQVAIAIGDAGKAVMEASSRFDRLLFEDAALPEQYTVRGDAFYYIGLTDTGVHYREMGDLYKACKRADVPFEYRVRNAVLDEGTSLLTGFEYLRQFIF